MSERSPHQLRSRGRGPSSPPAPDGSEATSASGGTSVTSPEIGRAGDRSAAEAAALAAAARATASFRSETQTTTDNSDVVIGVPIDDRGMGAVIKRVLVLAVLATTFYVVTFISELLRGEHSESGEDASNLWASVSSLLIELSIPACGYIGALYNNRQLVCCFCSCNLFIAIVSVISFVRLIVRIAELGGNCENEVGEQQRRSCEIMVAEGVDRYVMLSSTVAVVVMGILAFWFGSGLYNRLKSDMSRGGRYALVGEVISPAPGTSLPGAGPTGTSATSPASPAAAQASGAGTRSPPEDAGPTPDDFADASQAVRVDANHNDLASAGGSAEHNRRQQEMVVYGAVSTII